MFKGAPIKHLLLCISHDAEVPVAKYYRRPCRFGPVKGSMVRNLRLRAAKPAKSAGVQSSSQEGAT